MLYRQLGHWPPVVEARPTRGCIPRSTARQIVLNALPIEATAGVVPYTILKRERMERRCREQLRCRRRRSRRQWHDLCVALRQWVGKGGRAGMRAARRATVSNEFCSPNGVPTCVVLNGSDAGAKDAAWTSTKRRPLGALGASRSHMGLDLRTSVNWSERRPSDRAAAVKLRAKQTWSR
jgi:hypothetical protein